MSLFIFWKRDYNTPESVGSYFFIIALIVLIRNYLKNTSSSILDTDRINSSLNQLFKNSEHFLYIITPYFDIGENRLNAIYKAKGNGSDIKILVRAGYIKKETIHQLKKLQERGCDVKLHPDLHSKIYLNEKRLITASANLYEKSLKDNLEFGVKTENAKLIKQIRKKVETDYLNSDKTIKFNVAEAKKSLGYCIKSKREIRFNQKIPLSKVEWDKIPIKDRNDPSGNYCHRCGKESTTSRYSPFCDEHN